MGEITRTIFNTEMGPVDLEYAPHNYAKIRTGGLVATVCKPYRAGHNGWVKPGPVIQMSANSTVEFCYKDICRLQCAIKDAIDLLNGENDGNEIDLDFEVSNDLIDKNEIPEQIMKINSKPKAPKGIPHKEVKNNCIYCMENGRRYIYIGNGLLQELEHDGEYHNDNRMDSYEVYAELEKDDTASLDDCGTLNISCDDFICVVDTYKTKKKFTKMDKVIGPDETMIKEIIVTERESGYSRKYRFSPN